MARILVAEDQADMAMGLRDNLQFEGFEVIEAADGDAALKKALADRPDLILLDVMMPKMEGLEVCRRVREAGFTIPIIMLTAKSQEIDVIKGFEVGADDYVTKPFSMRELLARIRAALRRSGVAPHLSRVVRIGQANVDLVTGKVERGKEVFRMGHFEIEILKMLLDKAEQPVERNHILAQIWGLDPYPTNRTVDNHIVSLRRKIEEDAKNPKHIITVHSIGYKFVP
ncbi:MAG: DNA-binding response regulator [Planctomycetota bacterium]|nr:MAG: DNA-binding response regulator [Planctomycetota bacterium]